MTRWVAYTYDADANRASIQYPANAYSFTYNYTGRDQLQSVVDNNSATIASYLYDVNGNMSQRSPNNGTVSTYSYDALDRVRHITHLLEGNTRTFDYDYDSVGNRKRTKRDEGTGDVFGYDLNDQVTAVKLDIANPDTTSVGSQTIYYDANGNRTTFSTDTYTTNNLNQYTQRNAAPATYDPTGNVRNALDASAYTYDAQNRLLIATKSGVTETFTYDGLNRQVSRTIGAGAPTYNVYDGWDLIGEYASGAATPTTAYVSGAGGLVKNLTTNNYYYQDASGSTSHLADSTGHLLEWYRYDLQGTPVFYNASNTQISGSNYGVRHLFTGQQWYSELGLYDLRNRYYSPDIGRFLQADPSGFSGDATNLYRYCGNNPLKRSDPSGLGGLPTRMDGGRGDALDIGYHGGDGTGSVGWGLTGLDVTNVSGVLLDQAHFAYSMAPYGTSLYTAFASVGLFIGPGGIVTSGPPIRRAIPVNSAPQGTVTVGPITALRGTDGSNLTMATVIYAGVEATMYTGNASEPDKPLTTQSWGLYYDTTSNTIGTYESHGNGTGFDNGGQVLAGFVNGGTNTFASPFTNMNAGFAYAHESWNVDPFTMQIMGGSIGWGPTLPSLSTTYTNTTATPLFSPNTNLMFPYFGVPGGH